MGGDEYWREGGDLGESLRGNWWCCYMLDEVEVIKVEGWGYTGNGSCDESYFFV